MGESLSKAIIFDFDGTLVDSEKAIYECFQKITKRIAPAREIYAKNILIGPPLRDTASEILGPDYQDSLDKFVQSFIEMHDEQVIQHTQPYPDVIQVLKQLHAKKILMALATNKRLAPTQKLINHFGWNDCLSANLNQLPFIRASYGYGRDQDWTNVITNQEIHQFAEILNLI